jgi:DNA-binding MarR family transcriptional regulator
MKDPIIDTVANLLATGATLHAQLEALYGQFGLTASAYDVLRILREQPEGLPRGAIAQRLVSRSPDVTRLIDRLKREGLVKRGRTSSDRRLSLTRITAKGTELIARIEPAIDEYRTRIAPKLSSAEWLELNRLCERIKGSDE